MQGTECWEIAAIRQLFYVWLLFEKLCIFWNTVRIGILTLGMGIGTMAIRSDYLGNLFISLSYKKERMFNMAKVGIVMGSDSDMPIMAKAADILDKLGVEYEMKIISAHREPDIFFDWAKGAEERGIKVIIAGAGMAAHLPGMCAALFPMPVIGIPMHTTSLGGRDSLYSIVQMPTGIPVATVAINGGANAGILAAKILAVSDPELLGKLKAYTEEMKEQVVAKDARLQETGYKNYTK